MYSVTVKHDPWGRMGNRMFTYAFGRLLSIKRGDNCAFCADPLPNFKNTYVEKQTYWTPIVYERITTKQFGDNYVDFNALLTNKDVIVNSFLQKHAYYTDHKEQLNRWFNLDDWKTVCSYVIPQDDELVIHIRETDYLILKFNTTADFYIKTIKKLNYKKNTIVTDNYKSETIKTICKNTNCTVFSTEEIKTFEHANTESAMKDYYYMLHAKHLLMAQSTFSWWCAFLGDKKTVYYPVYNNCPWKEIPQQDDVDLYLKEFIKIYENDN